VYRQSRESPVRCRLRGGNGLVSEQRGERTTAGDQLVWPTFLDNAAFAEHDRAVGEEHGRETLPGEQNGATCHRGAQVRYEEALGLGVDRGGGLVEDQDARIVQEGAGDGDALPLAAGDGLAALAGAPFALQLVVAAAIGIGGSIWLRSTRFGKRLHERGDDRVQNMDIGQSLRVDNWTTARTARANYRGAVWDVELAPGEQPASGEFVIREIHANRLIVAPKPR